MTSNPKRKSSYEDIICLPHHVSIRRPQMPIRDRAAQFAPFAALTGHEEAVKETARLTEEKIQLGEDEKQLLDRKLQDLETKGTCSDVRITYFLPDQRKNGGLYVTIQGRIKRVDRHSHCLHMETGTEIPITDILRIDLKSPSL